MPVGIQSPNGLARAILESSTVANRSAPSVGVQLPGRILGMSLHHWAWAAFLKKKTMESQSSFSLQQRGIWFIEGIPQVFID